MYARQIVVIVVLLVLSLASAEETTLPESSKILKMLEQIERRLDRIEEEMRRLRASPGRPPGGEEARDIEAPAESTRPGRSFGPPPQAPGGEPPPDPAQMWQALGDPKELGGRLDKLAESFAPTILDAARREEFLKEVAQLKEKIGKHISEEELYNRVRGWFSERLAEATNEREKNWLREQLEALERSDGRDRSERLGRFVRIENIKALHDFGQKYSIPREEMVKRGLGFVGYRHGPPGKPVPSERGPRRGVRPPAPGKPETGDAKP